MRFATVNIRCVKFTTNHITETLYLPRTGTNTVK